MADLRTVDELLAERDLGYAVPGNFYLLFNLFEKDEDLPWVKEIIAGHMKGVVGISGDPRIIRGHAFRGGLLIMDGEEVIKANKVSRIQYENPRYLVQDNLAALRRIMNKSGSSAVADVIYNLVSRLIYSSKNEDLKHQEEWFSIASNVHSYYAKHPRQFKSYEDLEKWLYEALDSVLQMYGNYGKGLEIEKIADRRKFGVWLKGVFDRLVVDYEDEAEWRVKDEDFMIPKRGTRVYVLAEPSELAHYEKIWRSEDPGWIIDKKGTIKAAELLKKAEKMLTSAGFSFEIVNKETFKP